MRQTLLRAALGLALFFGFDAAVFRSGYYFSLVEPNSTLGFIRHGISGVATAEAMDTKETGEKPIVVLGDSRGLEGFSVAIANDAARDLKSPYRFVNGAVPGAAPKTINYLDRTLDASGSRFSGVVILIESMADDFAGHGWPCGYELSFIHPLLKLSDVPALLSSPCPDDGNVERLLLWAAAPGLNYRLDLRSFLADIPGRLSHVAWDRQNGGSSAVNYEGNPRSLEGLNYDPASAALSLPPGTDARLAGLLRDYAHFAFHPFTGSEPPETIAYYKRWITAVADRYARNGVPVFLVRVPRGPLHYLVHRQEPPTSPFLLELEKAGKVTLLPPDLLGETERPGYFFDQLHLNRSGREIMSRKIADAIVPLIGGPR